MNTKRLPNYRWVVLIALCLICFASNYIQFQVSSLAYIVMPELGLTTVQFSSLLMAPMLTAVFLSIPSGALGDRFGAKKVISVGAVISVIGAYGRMLSHSFGTMLVMLLACGVAIAFVNANLIKVLGAWFQEETGKAVGLFYASSCIGIVIAQLTGPMFETAHSAYIFSSTILLASAVLWLVAGKNHPEGVILPEPEPVLEYMKVAVKSWKTWLVAVTTGLGMGSTIAFAGILPQALIFGRGVDEATAGTLAAVVTAGSFFGALIGPAICGKLGRFKPFLTVTTLIGGALMYATWYAPVGLIMGGVLVLNGLFSALQGPTVQSMPILFPEIGEKYAGSAGGIVGTASQLISFVLPILISMAAGGDYTLNLGLEGVAFAASAICILILPELGPKGKLAQDTSAENAHQEVK